MKTKRILAACAGILLLLQFFPIDKDSAVAVSSLGLEALYNPPEQVMKLLRNACYDCHSNDTDYPWYARIQPVGWWIQDHVEEGRERFNFSTFATFSDEDRAEVLKYCGKAILNDRMPLKSYQWGHPEARLGDHEKELMVDWLKRASIGSTAQRFVARPEPDPCGESDEDPDCCFAGMPDSVGSDMYIASKDEPGDRLRINGRVFKADGKTPYPGVLIYAYHTDAAGIYPKKGNETGIRKWHGYLHGWCRTDADGRYSINSIRPGLYPNRRTPAHIHLVVKKPDGSQPFYITDIVFADDKLVDGAYKARENRMPGGSGIINVQKSAEGWKGKRIISLK
ncbi:MAG: heme-binding domain-containing protein [Saprospiraceae bacterium]|nr:heme-binding domain-containing protein [Saprospiraceae bacterium]